ncbi:hypothetical protein RU639_001496 [Aspergillus parasiticus]
MKTFSVVVLLMILGIGMAATPPQGESDKVKLAGFGLNVVSHICYEDDLQLNKETLLTNGAYSLEIMKPKEKVQLRRSKGRFDVHEITAVRAFRHLLRADSSRQAILGSLIFPRRITGTNK